MLTRALLAALLVLACAPDASAHKVLLNAWGEGRTLAAEIGFSDGSPGAGAEITVADAATGETLLRGVADGAGFFEAELPGEALERGHDLRVVGNAGAGHRAETLVPASEFAGVASAAPAAVAPADGGGAAAPTGLAPGELEALVRAAVREELRPLRRELEAQGGGGPELGTVLGGIGYIFGLAGVAALADNRRRRKASGGR